MNNPVTLGDKLRNRRIELQLLQKDVAAILDVTEDSITLWENNHAHAMINHYPKIISFLGYVPFPYETKTLGGKINLYRILCGLSYRNLGKLLGVDQTTIMKWESNQSVPLERTRSVVMNLVATIDDALL